jgi:uncharacterized membrane protein (DUF2068 family)
MTIIKKPLLTGMRTIAVIEATKGLLVLLAGLGLLALMDRDVQAVAERIVRTIHLNPASHYPRIFIDAAAHVTNGGLWMLAGAAAIYAIVRGVEAYGLWYERRWAEWFGLIAGGVYLPFEIYEMIRHLSWLKTGVFLTNLIVVAYLAYALLHSEEQDRELQESAK